MREVYRVTLSFLAQLPGFGYTTFSVQSDSVQASDKAYPGYRATEEYYEDDKRKISFLPDGRFVLSNLQTGKTYPAWHVFEWVTDVGDEYNFKANGVLHTSKNLPAQVALIEADPLGATYRIIYQIPVDTRYDHQKNQSVPAEAPLTTQLFISPALDRIDITTQLDNRAQDYRLRVLFPTDLETDHGYGSGQFDLARHNFAPPENWENPSNCQRMNDFVMIRDEIDGLAIATRGLPEYELLSDSKTIAVTLLRCVGELGDWMDFPHPWHNVRANTNFNIR